MEDTIPMNGTPPLQPLSLSETENLLKSPLSSPQGTLRSPSLSPMSLGSSPQNSSAPSPMLLPINELTPLNSRDEESAIYSDSDAASQSSVLGGQVKGLEEKRRQKGNSSRRRRSESEKSGRSIRSSSGQRDRVSQRTKIFRNLLILEESLRQQSNEQKALRRKFTAFLAALAGMEGFTIYLLYFIESGLSQFMQYVLKFSAFFILVTLVLFHLSGEYRRTIVIPRRFFNSTNKGLRQLNLRLVKVDTSFSDKFIDFTRYLLRTLHYCSISIFELTGPLQNTCLGVRVKQTLKNIELRAQPRIAATDLKLILNPRSFNAEIRESWELYRDEFWAREGSRRRQSTVLKDKEKVKSVMNRESLVELDKRQRREKRHTRQGI
jgi:hypothetical protein